MEDQMTHAEAMGVIADNMEEIEALRQQVVELNQASKAKDTMMSVIAAKNRELQDRIAPSQRTTHDEELLEDLYWQFDAHRNRSGQERIAFKGKMRWYANRFAGVKMVELPEPITTTKET